MKSKYRSLILVTIILFASTSYSTAVLSPDGNIKLVFELKDYKNMSSVPVYKILYRGKSVIIDSRLGLALKNGDDLENNLKIISIKKQSRDKTYTPAWGEKKQYRDHYNGFSIALGARSKTKESNDKKRILILEFRAYNEGAAFRYTFPVQESLKDFTISKENTHFEFKEDLTSYAVYSAQGRYSKVPLSRIGNNCERPLTMEFSGGPVISVGEAALVNYARMRLSHPKGSALTLVSSLGSEVKARAPFSTPWRVILIANNPCDLIEHNYLFFNLNDPCAIKDTSWIKPGKVIREVSLTTKGGKSCVDFASEHNLQYVEFDAGWYGSESGRKSDATTISVDPKRSRGPLDLHSVINYAKKKKIGILLYVNHLALEQQLDDILPLYEKWGVKGVKYGFVQVGSQKWTSWLHKAVRKAAAHHLMIDVHDEYRPTGYSRTYPNFMTQEGIRGNECMPTAGENLVLPFTRQLCGAGDYTVCYYSGRIKTTHAHQLAASVVFFSPFQFLFWYDRPSDYHGEPEIEFFEQISTVWDDTRVINGKIGCYITIARKSGDSWFVGSMTDSKARELDIPLSFLDKNKKYKAHIYSDGGSMIKTRTHVKITTKIVDSKTVLKAAMISNGGQAVWIERQ